MQLSGTLVRFCQQCGRFQALEEFEGSKKSCKKKLDSHNAQRKRKRIGKQQGGSATIITRKRSQSTAAKSKQTISPIAHGSSPSGVQKTNPIISAGVTHQTNYPLSTTLNNLSEESSHGINAPFDLDLDLHGIDFLQIDAMLDKLAEETGPIDMQPEPSAAYTAAPSLQLTAIGQSTDLYHTGANAAAAHQDALALSACMPPDLNASDQWSFAVPQSRGTVSMSLPLITTGAPNTISQPSSTAPINVVNLSAMCPVVTRPSPYAPAQIKINKQGGGFPACVAGWAPMDQSQPRFTAAMRSQSDVSRHLAAASFSLFNVPPSELPPEVCSALTDSLTTESMQAYLQLAMRLK